MRDGDKCPSCGSILYEGIADGMVVCLDCTFEVEIPSKESKDKKIYETSLYLFAFKNDKMVCEHCGKPIMLCNRCGNSGWWIIRKCKGKGFVHKDKGNFHHCRAANSKYYTDTTNTVAFPVLTDDEKRRLERYKEEEVK